MHLYQSASQISQFFKAIAINGLALRHELHEQVDLFEKL